MVTNSNRVQAAERLRGRLSFGRAAQFYQPQIDLQSGRIAGAEALLCAPCPQGHAAVRRLIQEIGAAGLSMALFEHQVREACRAQADWQRCFPHEFPVALAIPNSVFDSGLLLPLVLPILDGAGLAAGRLELEITESLCMANSRALRMLTSLRSAGFAIALSGVTAARVNLRLLSMIPFTKLRIDALTERRVLDGLIGTARGLGVEVCTTGVHSPGLLAAVARQVRTLAQGEEVCGALDAGSFLQRLQNLNEETMTLPCPGVRTPRPDKRMVRSLAIELAP